MLQLYSHSFIPGSRAVRLILNEYKLAYRLIEYAPWTRNEGFLCLNPAGSVPVLVDHEAPICGTSPILEYLHEVYGERFADLCFIPTDPFARAEMRRLMEWFGMKLHEEVIYPILDEKVYRRFDSRRLGGVSPDMRGIHAARDNLKIHLTYISYLMQERSWLGGNHLGAADLIAAAQLSAIDYFGDVPWDISERAKLWYARIKSRPSFRALLADRLPGVAPTEHYTNLDF